MRHVQAVTTEHWSGPRRITTIHAKEVADLLRHVNYTDICPLYGHCLSVETRA
jgi:hypothetical protein